MKRSWRTHRCPLLKDCWQICCGHRLLLGRRACPDMEIGTLQAVFLDGGWLGNAHFWPSGRLPRLVRLAPDELFEIPHIGPRTTLRYRDNLIFP